MVKSLVINCSAKVDSSSSLSSSASNEMEKFHPSVFNNLNDSPNNPFNNFEKKQKIGSRRIWNRLQLAKMKNN